MKRLRQALIAAAILSASAWLASDANAQQFCQRGGFYNGWFSGPLGYASNPYTLGYVPTPPYFALHPPVYYSHPVKRSYGLSPFAAPPAVAEPTPEPLLLANPFVTQEERDSVPVKEDHVAQAEPKPQMIENPYLSRREILASVKKSETR